MPSNGKNGSRRISSVTPLRSKSTAVQFLLDRYVGNDPEQIAAYEQEILNVKIARQLFDLRTKAGLSQRELADRIGTSASAICRLEDADYEGHSLSLLKRIAEALGSRIEISFVPKVESARRLAELGGSEKGLKNIHRRRLDTL